MKIFTAILSLLLVSLQTLADTSQDFGKWSLICGDAGNCSLSQIVSSDQSGSNIVLGATVNFAVSKDFPILMLRLPPSLFQQSGVGIKIDKNKPIQVPLSQCAPSACQSVIKMDKQLLDEMMTGENVQVAVAIQKNKQLTLPLSLEGFKKGFAALQQSQH
ncbi:invasion associated locus B family protein [Neptunicella sp. SCSIO 80796]|uniref:invasion associated locus B family protein n=1 Tax=Neptunicella plasticusilytica TaxID=3117012 RepID=UPI003A4DC7AE